MARDDDGGLPGRLTLLTDFGSADGYVAAMRGVIASRAPACMIDDASHDVPAGDVRAAAFALAKYWKRYPPGTVHVVVIDPGVGTDRRPIVVAAAGRYGVGPDNGVLTPMLEEVESIHEIRAAGLMTAEPSATFHGRDIFAPAAAFIAAGGVPEAVGPPVTDPVVLAEDPPVRMPDAVYGRIVHVDRFGTLVTNVTADLATGAKVEVGGIRVGPVRRTYGDVAAGEPVALIGSDGRLEIAVRDGNAASLLGLGRGAEVRVLAD